MFLKPLNLTKIVFQQNTILNLLAQFFLFFSLNLLLARFIVFPFWVDCFPYLHTLLESICAFIGLATFMVVWHTYSRNSFTIHLIGFSLFIAAIFQIFHVYYSLENYYAQYSSLALIYVVPLRVIEAFCLLITTFQIRNFRLNQWLGLGFSLCLTFIFALVLRDFARNLPEGVLLLRMCSKYLAIIILILTLYRIRHLIDNRELLTYRYIFLASLLAIVTELLGMPGPGLTGSFDNALVHLFRVATYYFLFKGIFVSAINYPYEQLEKAGSYNANILNSLPLGLVTYDSHSKLTFINQKGLDTLKCSLKEIKGLSNTEMINKFAITNRLTNNLVKTMEETKEFVRDMVVSIQDATGGKVSLKTNVHKLDSGDFLCFFTEAKKEQELENLQLQTQTILNSINSIVAVINKNKQLIVCNKAFENLIEMDSEDFLGMNVDNLFKLLNINQNNIADAVLQGKIYQNPHQVAFLTPKGLKKQVLLNYAPVSNIDGDIIGAICVGSDITLLSKEQQKIQQQEKLASLGQMATGIVHEIKNPLTTIKGFSQLIAAKTEDQAIKKYVATIEHEVEDVNKLVSDFLVFAKPHPPVLEESSLNNLIKSMNLLLETQSFIKGVDIDISLTSEEKMVLVDKSQIKQVILNIIENAIQAMNQVAKPHLVIKTGWHMVTQEMFLLISDNGIGISAKDKLMLGTPFFTTKDKGTGLGLSICYQIIKEHRGRIEIESKLNQGTSFTIFLPCK